MYVAVPITVVAFRREVRAWFHLSIVDWWDVSGSRGLASLGESCASCLWCLITLWATGRAGCSRLTSCDAAVGDVRLGRNNKTTDGQEPWERVNE